MTLGFQPQICPVEEVVPACGACYHGNTHTVSSSSRCFSLVVHGTTVVSDVKTCLPAGVLIFSTFENFLDFL